jgi:hypothetical protein
MHATDDDRDLRPTDPPALVAILIAARKTGDNTLALVARRELERHGIKVSFAGRRREKTVAR